MATVTKFAVLDVAVPRSPGDRATPFVFDLNVISGDGPNGDDIKLALLPIGTRVIGAAVRVTATLGATCTVQLRAAAVALAAATTAGAAGSVVQNAAMDPTTVGTETLNLLVGGAAITATATIRVTGFLLN